MTRESIIEKITKLLALSENNPSVNEAAAAAAMAQELMLKHKLSLSELEIDAEDDEPVIEYDVLRDEGGRSPRQWKITLLCAIAANNFCRTVYWSARFHVGDKKHLNYGRMKRGKMVVFGKKSDVDTVLYLYNWLIREVESLSKKAKQQLHERCAYEEIESIRTWADSFRKGCASAIGSKLYLQRKRQEDEIKAQAGAACTALVRVDKQEKEVDRYIESKYKVRSSGRQMNADEEAYEAGQRAAQSINLNPGAKKLGSPAKQIKE